jgi:hypothetical protein
VTYGGSISGKALLIWTATFTLRGQTVPKLGGDSGITITWKYRKRPTLANKLSKGSPIFNCRRDVIHVGRHRIPGRGRGAGMEDDGLSLIPEDLDKLPATICFMRSMLLHRYQFCLPCLCLFLTIFLEFSLALRDDQAEDHRNIASSEYLGGCP